MEDLDHKKLIEQCAQGDRQSLDQFVMSFTNLIYKCIQHVYKSRGMPVDYDEIDDIHNSIFLKLFENKCKKLRQYKGKNGCSVSSWIRVLTVRMVIDHLRKERVDALTHEYARMPMEVLEYSESGQSSPLQDLEEAEQWRRIRVGMDELLPRDRLFLKFHCVEGLAVSEVAALMGLSPGNAHSVKHRAVKKLRAVVLGEDGDGPGPGS